jgi:hypothetical protein
MKTKAAWQRHLVELVGATLDPTVYAVQWAHHPRCLQRGASHRRVGAFTQVNGSVCRLWAGASVRSWE